MAQGKCRPRFDLGDRNVGDGLGGSQLCGKPRWGDSTLEFHCVEMSAPTFLPSTCPLRPARTARSCDGCWTQSWTRDGARPNNSWRNMIAYTNTTCPLNKTWGE